MSRFQFRLQTLLKLRENERQQRQVELAQAWEAERILRGQIEMIAVEIAGAKDKVRAASMPGEVQVDSLLELQRYGWQLRAQALAAKERLVQIQAEVERRRKVLVEADRQVRMLEKLRDKQSAAATAELLHREQKTLDEMGQKSRGARF